MSVPAASRRCCANRQVIGWFRVQARIKTVDKIAVGQRAVLNR